jgi:alkylated DNA repair dioxygenase AlkB
MLMASERPPTLLQAVHPTDSHSYPIYRHPADESPPLCPFSPTVSKIRAHVERALQHPVNHVLIQLYRSGADYISEHSDKTIDVVRDSRIVNLSLGARRTMTLKTKKDSLHTTGDDGDDGAEQQQPTQRRTQRVPLPHNSLFVMGLQTNARWMHSVHTDKRPDSTKEPEERGARISLTFRRIGTFLTPASPHPQRIYGQGATHKTRAEAQPVVLGGAEAERLLAAFGAENHQSEFDWDEAYGEGFDVLHFAAAATPRELAERAGETA